MKAATLVLALEAVGADAQPAHLETPRPAIDAGLLELARAFSGLPAWLPVTEGQVCIAGQVLGRSLQDDERRFLRNYVAWHFRRLAAASVAVH